MGNSPQTTVGQRHGGGPSGTYLGSGLFLPFRDKTVISRAQDLTQRFEQAILEGNLPAGHRLGTKTELQKELEVATGTLNEALRVLQMQGLIEVRPGPGGGVFVAATTPNIKLRHGILRFRAGGRAIEECIATRNALEELVAAEAACSHDQNDLAAMYELLDHMAKNVGDPARFMSLNWQLHRRIAESGSNTVLTSIYCTLMDFVEDALEDTLPDEVYAQQTGATLDIHSNLVEAVASRNTERATKAAAAHTPSVTPLEGIGRE